MDKKGVTLIELLIVVGIIGILAAIAVPSYIGYQRRAARTEAFANLEALRLLEEQYFAQNGRYAPSTGTCAPNNPGNVAAIQASTLLPGFKPGSGLSFSYCIVLNASGASAASTGTTPCFFAGAYGNTGSRVEGDTFWIDCNNEKNF